MATHKALVLHEYGKSPVLQDFAKPEPKEGQVLVKVEASTINPSDRLFTHRLFQPKLPNEWFTNGRPGTVVFRRLFVIIRERLTGGDFVQKIF